jgi:hypothetical protein
VRIHHAHFNQKKNEMTKEQMIEIILREEREAREFMNEMVDTFGRNDDYTKRTIAQWCVIAELIEKLQIEQP